MNILMLGRFLPPPRRAVRGTREYQFARYLARSHRLTLAFVTDNPDPAGAISVLRADFGDLEFASVPRSWKSLASAVRLAAGESCTLSYFRSEALRTRLTDRLRRTPYDLVFVSASGMIQYALEMEPTVPFVVDFGEVESEWWFRQAESGMFPRTRFFGAEARRLRMAETEAARRAARAVVASPAAGQVVRSLAPGCAPVVIPNGVDTELFGSPLRPGRALTVVLNPALNDEAVVADAMGFCHAVLPAVRARIPDLRVMVVSREVPVAGAARLPGAEVCAPCMDLRPFLHDQAVAAVPVQRSGDWTAVLEPMAAGMAVVTTSKVNTHLGARAGCDLQVADEPTEFARQLIGLLEDHSARAAMGARGRAFVVEQYGWSVITRRLSEIVDPATQPGQAAVGAEAESPVCPRVR